MPIDLGYFAPKPDSPSGVADYARDLASALTRKGARLSASFQARNLYQLGNNRLHREIYAAALEKPDVVLLHDATLHHFLLGELTPDEYIHEFVYNYGEFQRERGQRLWEARADCSTEPDYFQFGLLRRVCERQNLVVVHSEAAKAIVHRHTSSVRVEVLPHLALQPSTIAPESFRTRIGVGQQQFLAGTVGYLRPSKRIHIVMRAFLAMADDHDAVFLLAGTAADPEFERSFAPWKEHPRFRRLPHLPESELDTGLAAIDLCVNLRYPSAAETSGIAIRAAAVATPVLLSEPAAATGLPPFGLCAKPGLAEQQSVRAQMVWAASHRDECRLLGKAAQRCLLQYHDADRVAEQLIALLS